jgi:hypothetical protein
VELVDHGLELRQSLCDLSALLVKDVGHSYVPSLGCGRWQGIKDAAWAALTAT